MHSSEKYILPHVFQHSDGARTNYSNVPNLDEKKADAVFYTEGTDCAGGWTKSDKLDPDSLTHSLHRRK